jgi:enterochelin esterase-like enzyme
MPLPRSASRAPWPRGQPGSRARPPAGRLLSLAAAVVVGAAVTVAGGLGAYRYLDTYWLYRGFPSPSQPRSVVVHRNGAAHRVPVEPASVHRFTLTTRALGGFPDTVYVMLPAGYASHPQQHYPVLYLLHGNPGEPDNFLTVGRVQIIESALQAAGKIKPMILVMPTGGRSFFNNGQWANGVGAGNHWETFVARDLVGTVDHKYRAITGRSGRGIAGLSEGGYGSLNVGLHNPAEFGLLESWSGYMWADAAAIFGFNPSLEDYNSPASYAPHVAGQLRSDRTYIWFYCGTSDYLRKQDRYFSAELSSLGVAHEFFEHHGGHSWALWRTLMPASLIAASEHLSHG